MALTITLPGYYNRYDPAQHYDLHLFRAGSVLQAAELNELQAASLGRLRNLGDTLYNNGDLISNAALHVDADTGETVAEEGVLYLQGFFRPVERREFTIPIEGTINVGVWLLEAVITDLEDPTLRDPAVLVQNAQEPGAARLQRTLRWGYPEEPNPPTADFFPVYTVVDGVVMARKPPPSMEAILQAIAAYDRQSAGGYYVVQGLKVSQLDDDGATQEQQYSIQEGVARINGQEVTLRTAVRARLAATPDLGVVESEPFTAGAGPTQRLDVDFTPIATIDRLTIITQKTATLTHGSYSGAVDPLPDPSVLAILSVVQGATTYVLNTDVLFVGNSLDWSPAGQPEPAPDSSYDVTYTYLTTTEPINPDATGCTVSGAVPGTLILFDYHWKRPRIDRLCLNGLGEPVFILGVASNDNPRAPSISPGLLSLAMINQTWTAARAVSNVSVRVVPMQELERMGDRIDNLYSLMADQRLLLNAVATDPTAKKGIFVDPFFDDDLRDQGLAQTAAIVNRELTLGITATTVEATPANAPAVYTLPETTPSVVIQQLLYTGTKQVNPYLAFEPLPATAELTPSLDFWTEYGGTRWLSPITLNLTGAQANFAAMQSWWEQALREQHDASDDLLALWKQAHTLIMTDDEITVTQYQGWGNTYKTEDAKYLRTLTIQFDLEGFGPGEILSTVKFDGMSVAFTA